MGKQKFYFNKENGEYLPIKKNRFKALQFISSIVFLTVFFVGIGLFLGYHYIIKPKTASQAQLAHELETMETQYKILNKKFEKTQEVLGDLEDRDNHIYRSFFELAPIPKDVRNAGFGGIDRYEKFAGMNYGDLMAETTKNLDILNKQLVVQSQSLDEVLESAKDKEDMFRHIPAMQPITNKELNRLASGYGMRLHPILKIGRMHWGMDFSAPTGTPIYATGDATVSQAGTMGGYGNVVVLNHGYGYETLYAHMNRIKTKAGAKVKRGDIIGYVGNTGLSSGPHLHYEIHKNGDKLDPISFFNMDVSPDEFKVLYEKSQQMTVSLD